MNPEMQILVDRIETLERQTQGSKLLVTVALVLAAAAIAIAFLGFRGPQGAPPEQKSTTVEHARYGVVEANRFLLRDFDGRIAGGIEVGRDSTTKLVLGRTGSATAFLEVRSNGMADLTLRGADGAGRPAGLILQTSPDGSGALQLTDQFGRVRFKAP